MYASEVGNMASRGGPAENQQKILDSRNDPEPFAPKKISETMWDKWMTY